MQSWYYSQNGKQRGPVSLDALRDLIRNNELNVQTDLAWTDGMADWQAPAQIPALLTSDFPSAAVASPDQFNPYAAPTTAANNLLAPRPGGDLMEIEPGSVSLDVMKCINRGFELTKRHFGTLVLIGFVYLVLSMAVGALEGFISGLLEGTTASEGSPVFHPLMIPVKLISSVISVVLAAGMTRAALNVCAGKEATVGNLFEEIGKVGALIVASILFYLLFLVGLILLVVPGIYVGLRFSFFVTAIVDRNLGPVEALKYSHRITTNNALSLFGLAIMSGLIVLAGVLALLVGLFFAIPVVTLAFTLAYRYLQFGPEALRDPVSSPPLGSAIL
jgi:hypothetical protein